MGVAVVAGVGRFRRSPSGVSYRMGGRSLMMSKVRDKLEGLGLSEKAERGVLDAPNGLKRQAKQGRKCGNKK